MWRAALLALALAVSQHALGEKGTIRIVLGFPAGASSDLLTRMLADQMMRSPVVRQRLERQVGPGDQGFGIQARKLSG